MLYMSLPNCPSMELMNSVNDTDPMAIEDMFTYHFQVQKADRLPDIASDSAVFVMMMKFRLEEIGNRVVGWFDKCIKQDGTVNWVDQPLFKLE